MEKQPHSRLYREDLEECRLEYSESLSAPCRHSSDDPRPFLCRLPNRRSQAAIRSLRTQISSLSWGLLEMDIVAGRPAVTHCMVRPKLRALSPSRSSSSCSEWQRFAHDHVPRSTGSELYGENGKWARLFLYVVC